MQTAPRASDPDVKAATSDTVIDITPPSPVWKPTQPFRVRRSVATVGSVFESGQGGSSLSLLPPPPLPDVMGTEPIVMEAVADIGIGSAILVPEIAFSEAQASVNEHETVTKQSTISLQIVELVHTPAEFVAKDERAKHDPPPAPTHQAFAALPPTPQHQPPPVPVHQVHAPPVRHVRLSEPLTEIPTPEHVNPAPSPSDAASVKAAVSEPSSPTRGVTTDSPSKDSSQSRGSVLISPTSERKSSIAFGTQPPRRMSRAGRIADLIAQHG